jgi:hypothetical protein
MNEETKLIYEFYIYKVYSKDPNNKDSYIGHIKTGYLCKPLKKFTFNRIPINIKDYIKLNGGFDKWDIEVLEVDYIEYKNMDDIVYIRDDYIQLLKPTLNKIKNTKYINCKCGKRIKEDKFKRHQIYCNYDLSENWYYKEFGDL